MIFLKQLARILKIFIGFFVLLLLFINLSIFVFLSFPFVQNQIVNTINKNFLNNNGLAIGLSSLDVVLWPSSVILNDTSLSTYGNQNGLVTPLLSSRRIIVSLDVPKSYLQRKLIFKSFYISGVDLKIPLSEDGTQIDLEFLKNTSQDTTPPNPLHLISQLKEEIPPVIEFSSVHLALENPLKTISYKTFFKSFVFENPFQQPQMNLSLAAQDSIIKHHAIEETIFISSLNSKIQVHKSGKIQVEQFSFLSNFLNATTKGTLKLHPKPEQSSYHFDVKSELNNKNVLQIFKLQSSGKSIASFSIKSPNLSSIPVLSGDVVWEKSKLNQYDLHDGKTYFNFKNKRLELSNVFVQTEKKGTLAGTGSFDFSGEFPFEFNVNAKSFWFGELMAGLGVATNAFEFQFSSKEPIKVSGLIKPVKKTKTNESFFMGITSVLEAKGLLVPSMGAPKNHGALPDSTISVKLVTTDKNLNLSGTELSFSDELGHISRISATLGTISYTNGETLFRLTTPKINLAPIGYFLGSKSGGHASIQGELNSGPNQPLNFKAQIEAYNALIYSVNFSQIKGHWGINSSETYGNNLSGLLAGDSPNPPLSIELKEFKFRFKDSYIDTVGKVHGPLENFFANSSLQLPQSIRNAKGLLTAEQVVLKGPLFDPFQWTFRSDIQIKNGHFLDLNSFSGDIFVDCTLGQCYKNSAHVISPQDSYSFQVLVGELSKEKLMSQVTFNSFPLHKVILKGPQEKNGWTSHLFGNLNLTTTWKAWHTSGQLTLNDNTVYKNALSPINLDFKILNKFNEITIKAQNDQAIAQVKVPETLNGNITSTINLNKLDISDFIPISLLKKNGYATLTGTIQSDFNTDNFRENKDFIKTLTSEARLNKVNMLISDQHITVPSPIKFKLSKGKIFVSQLELTSKYFYFRGGGFTDLIADNSDFAIDIDTQLDLLKEFTTSISSAKGDANLGLRVSGPISNPILNGTARIKKSTINLNEFGPNIENLEGQFSISGNKLEINYLRANKGIGKIDAVGSLSLSKNNHDIALKMTMDNAEFRIPLPVLQTLDSNISGEVTLAGSQKPYTLGGQIKIVKARAFRDISCPDINSELSGKTTTVSGLTDVPNIEFALRIIAENDINIQTQCFRGRVGMDAQVAGNSLAPIVMGKMEIPMGQVNLLKGRFTIRQASLFFDNPVRIDPRADIQMDARIGVYNIFLTLEGPMSRIKVNLWTDPATLPKSDSLITQQDIIDMLSSGSPPNENAQRSTSRTVVNVFSTLFDTGSTISGAVNQALNKATLGLVETVHFEPLIENGETKGRVRLTHNIADRFNLGMEILTGAGSSATSTSLSGTLLLSENVNLLGGYSYKPTLDKEQQKEFTGGMRFQFGSR